MRRRIAVSLLPALFLVLSACAAGEPAADLAAEEQAIRELDARWNQAIADRDVETIVGLYADDGYLAPTNSPRISGADALRDAWTHMLDLTEGEAVITPVEIDVARAGDMAMETGDYRLAFRDGDQLVEDSGKYVVVWKKVDGAWKVAADIFNTNLPAAH